ncbi:MAG: hypothetical protein HYZ28_20290 [Myxococcales bacterium]|nr:hypothetical protein [Myxococcales bacterium]
MQRGRVAVAVLAAALLGCPEDGFCGAREEPVLRADGGVVSCIRAEDCPRPSGVFVCTTTGPQETDCVKCEQTACVRVSPLPRPDGGACP